MIIIEQISTRTRAEDKKGRGGRYQNLLDIISLLKHGNEMTRQEVAGALGISMPTALHCIEELLTKDIIVECGENASTGGRRAKVFSLNREAAYGIGIQVTRRHVRFALTDLAGQVQRTQKLAHPFADEMEWYRQLGMDLDDFIRSSAVDAVKILGAGLSFPGIIDQETHRILHSHVFDISNISLDRFRKCIGYPLIVANDANCACYAEQNQDKDSYFYLSLNESVGGALMLDHRLVTGTNWRAGEAGHVVLHPGGKRCYCGKAGCADAYLWTGVLLKENEELDDFFSRLEEAYAGYNTEAYEYESQADTKKTWDDYLHDLAILVSNINMMLDMDIILGGDVGAQMEPYIDRLSEIAAEYDNFSRDVDYILPCQCRKHIFLAGAALYAIDQFDYRLLESGIS
ncbi:MAG: ROK family protein [Eubacterium sp.]|nr:ROK family protein [Eubacterium sp.]